MSKEHKGYKRDSLSEWSNLGPLEPRKVGLGLQARREIEREKARKEIELEKARREIEVEKAIELEMARREIQVEQAIELEMARKEIEVEKAFELEKARREIEKGKAFELEKARREIGLEKAFEREKPSRLAIEIEKDRELERARREIKEEKAFELEKARREIEEEKAIELEKAKRESEVQRATETKMFEYMQTPETKGLLNPDQFAQAVGCKDCGELEMVVNPLAVSIGLTPKQTATILYLVACSPILWERTRKASDQAQADAMYRKKLAAWEKLAVNVRGEKPEPRKVRAKGLAFGTFRELCAKFDPARAERNNAGVLVWPVEEALEALNTIEAARLAWYVRYGWTKKSEDGAPWKKVRGHGGHLLPGPKPHRSGGISYSLQRMERKKARIESLVKAIWGMSLTPLTRC